MSQDELAWYLLPREDIVATYVVENMVDGKVKVTDFFSVLSTCQRCINTEANAKGHQYMHFAMMYYYGLTKNSLSEILK